MKSCRHETGPVHCIYFRLQIFSFHAKQSGTFIVYAKVSCLRRHDLSTIKKNNFAIIINECYGGSIYKWNAEIHYFFRAMKKTFEITIPVLNEEDTLSDKITELHRFLADHYPGMNWGIVIGDNGSADNTLSIGKKLESQFPNVRLVSVGERGVGRALKHSWARSDADILASMDLDLSTDIIHITESIDAINNNNYDLVYASRLHKNSKVAGRSYKRELTSRGFNFLIRKYLKVKISDGMCGFIFFKKEVFDKINTIGIDNNRWFFQTELLVMADWLKYRICELPVKWTDDPNSKVKVIRLALEYLQDMKLLRMRRKTILQHQR